MTLENPRRLYLIPVLSRALDIIELFESKREPLTLESVYSETRIPKTTCYRVLKTFVHRGYLSRSEDGLYRHVSRSNKLKFGFAGISGDSPFSVEVTESLEMAATIAGVDLVVLDNGYDAASAIRNAEEFVRQKVDLVIELHVEERAAPVVADKIASAKIPLIAVDIPHPHSTYFGVDNYRVGFEAGELLGMYAQSAWGSNVDCVVGLAGSEAGTFVQNRITGAFEGARNCFPNLPIDCFVRMDGRGLRDRSRKIVSEFLKCQPTHRHILLAATSDTSALGATDAVRESNREGQVAIVGQGCIAEAIGEMRKPRSPLIGSVSHKTSTYGPSLLNLGLAVLRGDRVAPYNYVAHQMVTPRSLTNLLTTRRSNASFRSHINCDTLLIDSSSLNSQ